MPSIAYATVDVFTTTPFSGNPLAVIPDARGLSDADMQKIATEFNYSESTFVLPPSDPTNTAQVRIFTPTTEVPFAGHPNVGTAYVLGSMAEVFGKPVGSVLRFEEEAGLVEVELARDGDRVVSTSITAPRPLEIGSTIDPATIAACTGLSLADIATRNHSPVFLSVGLKFAFAELADLDALGRAKPDPAAFEQAAMDYLHEGRDFSLFVYARLGDSGDLRARMFAPLDNVTEDPATGSASAALAAYHASLRPEADGTFNSLITQGVEMGRRSEIHLAAEKTGGVVGKVRVAGSCVPVMRGTIAF